MTEGCEGGWPHYNSLFAENAHVVQEACAPYKATTKGIPCSQFEKCSGEARVLKSYDVGGGYGQTSEKTMMKEILRNGALNTEFEAPEFMATYKSGLMSQAGIQLLNAIT